VEVTTSESAEPVLWTPAGPRRREAELLRNLATRAAAENLAARFRAAGHRNRALRVEMDQQRADALRRRDLLRLGLEGARQTCASLRRIRPACRAGTGAPSAAGADAERVGYLHIRHQATGEHADRAELLAAYDGFALAVARRFGSRREAPDDLAQVARVGLLKALDRFEPARGRPFTAYARATIVGELKRHVRDRTWSMRVPRSLQEQYLMVVQALEDLTHQLGRSPRIPELAARAGLTVEQVLQVMELGRANRPISLDVPATDGDGRLLDPGEDDTGFAGVEGQLLLGTLLARLSDRERQVLHLRFVEERTQAEIAGEIGMSQMYVSRLLTRTLARLRAWAN
jgi:RNA polymerase sigma-B factor